MFPEYLYALLPYDTDYNPYDLTHTLAQLQLLFFSALAFVWLNKIGRYPPELRSVNLDIDWFYRRLFPSMINRMAHSMSNLSVRTQSSWALVMQRIPNYISDKYLKAGNPFSSSRPASSMVLSVVVFFVLYLMLSFVQ